MRAVLVVFFCALVMPASAQWLSLKKHERLPLLQPVYGSSVHAIPQRNLIKLQKLKVSPIQRSEYSLELEENLVMKTAQHNMRFRVYNTASYNFSDLAKLYIQQGRLSEAKWFFLQSNFLSRQQNNDRLTITNLMYLAGVKSKIGDFILAQQDLIEAREMAASHGWLIDLVQVEKKLRSIQNNRITSRTELRYASNALDTVPVL